MESFIVEHALDSLTWLALLGVLLFETFFPPQ
jgi:hypothetical protein